MGQVKVSVIVPVYNVEKYLDQCLKSLVKQTLQEIEILVVNDAKALLTGMRHDILKKYLRFRKRTAG